MPGELSPMESPVQSERPARKRRTKFAAGTMPPPAIEELPSHLLKEEPPAIPASKDTREALETLKAHAEEAGAEKEEWETKQDAAEAAAAAAEERKQMLDARSKESFETAHAILEARKDMDKIPDMTDEAQFEDPQEEFEHQMEKGWPKIAEHHLKDEAAAMKAVESLEKEEAHEEGKKKRWWERLRDIL